MAGQRDYFVHLVGGPFCGTAPLFGGKPKSRRGLGAHSAWADECQGYRRASTYRLAAFDETSETWEHVSTVSRATARAA